MCVLGRGEQGVCVWGCEQMPTNTTSPEAHRRQFITPENPWRELSAFPVDPWWHRLREDTLTPVAGLGLWVEGQ